MTSTQVIILGGVLAALGVISLSFLAYFKFEWRKDVRKVVIKYYLECYMLPTLVGSKHELVKRVEFTNKEEMMKWYREHELEFDFFKFGEILK